MPTAWPTQTTTRATPRTAAPWRRLGATAIKTDPIPGQTFGSRPGESVTGSRRLAASDSGCSENLSTTLLDAADAIDVDGCANHAQPLRAHPTPSARRPHKPSVGQSRTESPGRVP